jgi:hypothetical protein
MFSLHTFATVANDPELAHTIVQEQWLNIVPIAEVLERAHMMKQKQWLNHILLRNTGG